jgi:hypothetical protein
VAAVELWSLGLVTKLVTKWQPARPTSGEKKTRAGVSNNPLRVEIGRGSKFATRARARRQPAPAGEGLPNPRFSLLECLEIA